MRQEVGIAPVRQCRLHCG